MPISLRQPIRRLSQQEFGDLSFEVMRHVFAIHNEMGRFFDEKIYKRELAHRMAGVRLEEPIDISFDSFQKRCSIDVLVADGGIFEFKSVESLVGRHRAQLLHYLMLCEVEHGKLINVRPLDVQHEFVNCSWIRSDRIRFGLDAARWSSTVPGAVRLQEFLTGLLRDVGAGLELGLYEEAVEHCFGGKAQVEVDVAVQLGGHSLGHQRMRLIAPGVAVKLTAISQSLDGFESHARRFLAHADLRAIAWVNIDMQKVTFATLEC